LGGGRGMGAQRVGLQSDQLFCECLNSDCVGIAPAIIDSEVASIRPAELLKALPKYSHAGADIRIAFRNRHQHADTTNSLRLLRARRERPRGYSATNQRDELAPLHCPLPPVLRTKGIAHLSYGRRLLRCEILIPAMTAWGYHAGSVERLVALTDERADFSRKFASSFPLRGLVYSGEASGQLLFDGVVRRFESAQSQFGCQIIHRYFTGSILASKPVLDCGSPAFA